MPSSSSRRTPKADLSTAGVPTADHKARPPPVQAGPLTVVAIGYCLGASWRRESMILAEGTGPALVAGTCSWQAVADEARRRHRARHGDAAGLRRRALVAPPDRR